MSRPRGLRLCYILPAKPAMEQLVYSLILQSFRHHKAARGEAAQPVTGAEASSSRLLAAPQAIAVPGDVASFDIVAVLN